MTTKRSHRRSRGVITRVVESGVLAELSLDGVIAIALVLIGVSVYRLSPSLVWGYAGLVVLIPALIVAHQRAAAAKDAGKATP